MNSELKMPEPLSIVERNSDWLNGRVRVREMRIMLYMCSLAFDCVALACGFAVSMQIRDGQWLASGSLSFAALAIPLFMMFSVARSAQGVETLQDRSLGIRRAEGALFATAICLIILTFVIKIDTISRLGFAVAFGMAAVFLVISRLILNLLKWRMLGANVTAQLLILDGVAASPEPGMDVANVGKHGLWPDVAHPEMLHALSTVVANYDRVVVACADDRRHAWSLFLRGSDVGGEIIVENNVVAGAVAIGQFGNKDTLIQSLGPLSEVNRLQKRVFDVAIALPALIVLSPLFLVVAIAIKLETRGPVLFRQTRVGEGNRQFQILKFRSMRVEQLDATGKRSVSRDDDRITRVGALIRRTSIDEMPQLLNVLRGQMSLVGPRPHALGSLAGETLFWNVTEHYWLRHSLKPGITGLAQVRGFRGSTEQHDDLTQRLRCDLEYVTNWSVLEDFFILLKTVRVMIHKNAY